MMARGNGRLLAVIVSLCVITAITRGLFVLGPIQEQRDLRLDRQRIADLQRIVAAVDAYADANKSLPESLEALGKTPGFVLDIADPESGKPYGYTKRSSDTYELCAEFAMPSGAETDFQWAHRSGRSCFLLTASKGARSQ